MKIFGVDVEIYGTTDAWELMDLYDQVAINLNKNLGAENPTQEDGDEGMYLNLGIIDIAIAGCDSIQDGSEEFMVELAKFRRFLGFINDLCISQSFAYGADVVADNYGSTYAENNTDLGWAQHGVDWEIVWDTMKQNFHKVEYEGEVYWVKS